MLEINCAQAENRMLSIITIAQLIKTQNLMQRIETDDRTALDLAVKLIEANERNLIKDYGSLFPKL